MARGPRDERPASEQVAWVKYLPKEGGDWGRGVTSTVASTETELADLEKRYEAMCADHRAKEDELAGTIRSRQKLLLETARRAGAEVPMLYADAQIQAARAQADKVAKEAQAQAEKTARDAQAQAERAARESTAKDAHPEKDKASKRSGGEGATDKAASSAE